jgi:hypothetical protein
MANIIIFVANTLDVKGKKELNFFLKQKKNDLNDDAAHEYINGIILSSN